MITKLQYVEFLISTVANYTGTYLAESLDQVSHDTITDFLRSERLTARHLWELVHRQYSSAEHGLVRGIGVVNLVHNSGRPGEFYPIDYRIYDPDSDGQTKNEHFREMLVYTIADKLIKARTVLIDSWYVGADNLKLIHQLSLIFFTTLKESRLVSLSKENGYIHLDQIEWTSERLKNGVVVKLKEVPFQVRLFKLVSTNGDTPALACGASVDWVITNAPDETLTAPVAQNANDVRWQVEELNRGLKQPTGSEKCQCQARSQRNHLTCCYHAWLYLKVIATKLNKTLYEVKTVFLRDYLQAELRNPHVPAFQPA